MRFEACYLATEIYRVFEQETPRGYGLKLELSSGKKHRLTLFSQYASLGGQAGVLNEYLRTSRHGKGGSARSATENSD